MNAVAAIARQELLSLRRERLPLVLLVVFVLMVSVSSLIGRLTTTTVSSVWEKTTQAGLTSAPNPFADVSGLYFARNTVIYLVLIGALMAIVVGVTSAMRDRKARTLDLVLSRPLTVRSYVAGKVLGVGAWLSLVLAGVGVISWGSISVISGAPLGAADTGRLIAFYALALLLLLAFVMLGMASGMYSSRETTALLVPISIWSITAFVLPQIGTSANPVSLLNPVPAVKVPGGAFDALNAVLSPLSVTEQFKTASGLLLKDAETTGSLPTSLTVIILAVVIGAVVLATVKRDRIRGALRD
ncbi:MAG: ABC transporter permease [Vicinamibacterales bacterium]